MILCQISARECKGTINEFGKALYYERFYIIDASILLSASGVNPIIVGMALCKRIACVILKPLAMDKQEKVRE
jgi:choline dehydrogenase-like flavoprotein